MDGHRPASCPHLRFAGWLLALATFVGAPIQADLPAAPARVEEGLARLVDDALAANLELRAGSATVEQRLAALDQARARYMPVIDFAARYSVADGGRTIDFPAADLLNPVYESSTRCSSRTGNHRAFRGWRTRRSSCCGRTSRRRSSSSSSRSTNRGSRRGSRPAGRSSRGRRQTFRRCARVSCATCDRRTTSGSLRSRR